MKTTCVLTGAASRVECRSYSGTPQNAEGTSMVFHTYGDGGIAGYAEKMTRRPKNTYVLVLPTFAQTADVPSLQKLRFVTTGNGSSELGSDLVKVMEEEAQLSCDGALHLPAQSYCGVLWVEEQETGYDGTNLLNTALNQSRSQGKDEDPTEIIRLDYDE